MLEVLADVEILAVGLLAVVKEALLAVVKEALLAVDLLAEDLLEVD